MLQTGRPHLQDRDAKRIQEMLFLNLTWSTGNVFRELGIAWTRILHEELRFQIWKVQLLQALEPNDTSLRNDFVIDMFQRRINTYNFSFYGE